MPTLRLAGPDGELQLVHAPLLTVRDILDRAGRRVRAACGGTGACGFCRIRVVEGAMSDPTPAETSHLGAAELRQGHRLACQARPTGDARITVENPVSPAAWRSLSDDEVADPTALAADLAAAIARGAVAATGGRPYGVAVDLGTTQVRLSVWDLDRRRRLATRCGPNPQATFGADVLTRVAAAAGDPATAYELAWLARGAIGDALADIAGTTSLDPRQVGVVVIVGNTAMLSLLAATNHHLLLLPENWTRAIDCTPAETGSWTAAWGVDPGARVVVVPPVGGFVGSDFLAASLATGLAVGPAGSLLVDVGTNSEIGLWDGRTLWVTSAAGGPAFEGSGITCGMPAEPGAIYRVDRAESSPAFRVQVIGGGDPDGLCGSGLVDLLATLVEAGRLSRAGRLADDAGGEGILVAQGRRDVRFTRGDVDAVQRAKAAIAAGIACLLEQAGLHGDNLARVAVCGAFGRWLDLARGQEIGLLPQIPAARFELHGDAALTGCEAMLLAGDGAAVADPLRAKTRQVNLAQVAAFEDRFIESLDLGPMRLAPAALEGSA
jgi:uncharacterized 2Fe-2S/4Fe-4S cluster protein (DUF4445 family)